MKKLFGVITAMTTPFDTDNKVDVNAIREQTEFLIEKGVQCLYPTGTTGEMFLMTPEERKLVAETVVKTANHRVTVFVHTGAMTIEETIELSKHAHDIGADGVGIVTPAYFNVEDRAMVQYYKDICNNLPDDFPVYTYVIPQLAKNDISPELMEEIVKECSPNVIGVKYSYPDLTRLLEYTRVNNGDFSVVFGADHMFLPALTAGADGTVSGCSGPCPELFVKVYELFKQGKLKEAEEAQKVATDWCWLTRSGADMSIFKNILTDRGITGGYMRPPLRDLPKDDVTKLLEKTRKYYQS